MNRKLKARVARVVRQTERSRAPVVEAWVAAKWKGQAEEGAHLASARRFREST